jgi:hypothetical protein
MCQVLHSLPQADVYHPPDAPEEEYLIAVMLRCDVFRHARSRTLDSKPSPSDMFDVVNFIVARHIANGNFVLPNFEDVVCTALN